MDQYDLESDPCDRRMIRFTNCLMMLACICDILAMIDNSFAELAGILRMIADCVFYSMMGCMAAQVHHEVEFRKNQGDSGFKANTAYEPPVSAQPTNAIAVKAEPIN